MQQPDKKSGSIVEIVVLLLLVGVSVWIPRQDNFFSKENIAEASIESASYLNSVEAHSLLMTSDKVVLPDAWSQVDESELPETRVLKLRSKQVRFVQLTVDGGAIANLNSRAPASISPGDVWVVESVKRLGLNGQVETLQIADIDGERTTPYVELGHGYNEFSVVYHLKSDHHRVQRKKLRLLTATEM